MKNWNVTGLESPKWSDVYKKKKKKKKVKADNVNRRLVAGVHRARTVIPTLGLKHGLGDHAATQHE